MIGTPRRPDASNRPMARRLDDRQLDARRRAHGSMRRVAVIAAVAGLAFVAAVGVLHPQPVAGGAQPAVSAAPAGDLATTVGSVWDSGSGGFDWVGLLAKCLIVLVLLFITLRVLNRMQSNAPRKGGRLQVLESRPLAAKASLHLVAVGDRRLVVGLTPNGMVSLAELDAGELEAAAEREAEAAASGAAATGLNAGVSAPLPPAFGSVLAAVSAPIDAVTGRIAGLLGGSRVR